MKATSKTTRPFPKPARFSLYLGAVLILSFFNWVALQAEGPSMSLENRLAAAIVEEVEAEIQLENWMLTYSDGFLADAEPGINLEPWMLTFSGVFTADSEPELDLEPWMLSYSDDLITSGESEMAVEKWMTDTFVWNTAFMLAKK